jgi:hypothetical protein
MTAAASRPRAIVCLLGLLVFGSACSPRLPLPEASSPPAAPRAVRGAAEAVVLQPADVPSGYELDSDDAMSAQALADGLGITTVVLKERGAAGYIRAFKDPALPFVCCLIDSILIITADEPSARATFADFRAAALALGSVEADLGATLGDESRGLVFTQATPDGELITVTMLFRYANAVDAVEVTGKPGSFERPYVLEFARKQLEHLRADAKRT